MHDNFTGYRVIGVHYRGTDKVGEVAAVQYSVIIALIQAEIEIDPDIKIFVATDEQRFLKEMCKNFPGKVVAIDAIRSTNGYPVHYPSHRGAVNYQKGEEALVDCIVLSQCSKLYRTSSNLSSASMRFNPTLEVIVLSKGFHE